MKIVEVEWIDAHYEGGWKPKIALEDAVRKDLKIVTLGYLIEDTDDRIILTHGIDGEGEQYQGYYLIPKGCVLNIKEIKKEIKKEKK